MTVFNCGRIERCRQRPLSGRRQVDFFEDDQAVLIQQLLDPVSRESRQLSLPNGAGDILLETSRTERIRPETAS